jgi:hypothetical protein
MQRQKLLTEKGGKGTTAKRAAKTLFFRLINPDQKSFDILATKISGIN